MLKKITAIISTDHKVWARRARLIVGVTLGIGIGLLLNKGDESDVVFVEKVEDQDGEATSNPVEDGEEKDDTSVED